MDQRIAWPQPEQLGPSCEHWSRIWEAFNINESNGSTLNGNHVVKSAITNSQIHSSKSSTSNCEENQHEKLLTLTSLSISSSSSVSKQSIPPTASANRELCSLTASSVNQTTSTNDQETMKRSHTQNRTESNPASTSGLGNAENLPLLENNDMVPWARPAGYNAKVPVLGLHEEIVDFYAYVSPTEEECFMREQVAARMCQLVTTVWPGARVEIFGSFKTGLYLPTSDIDMVVSGVSQRDNNKPPLRELERMILERRISEPHNVKVLDNATVPIIRVTDRETDVRVDISFSSTESPSCVRSAELIRGYMRRYEPLRYLVLVLKQFLLERGLNETWTGGVGSYSLILMVVHFLQNHERGEATKNYGALLVEFFETFGERFNYQHLVLRVMSEVEAAAAGTSGGTSRAYLKKEEFTRSIQREEPSYCPSMLTIEDPLEPRRDIARGSYGALYARKAFQHALHALREPMLGLSHSLLVRNRLGNVPTYLGRIVRITREVTEYREQVRRKFRPLLQTLKQQPATLGASTAFVDATGFVRVTNNHPGAKTQPSNVGDAFTAGNGVHLANMPSQEHRFMLLQPPHFMPHASGPAVAGAPWPQPFPIQAINPQRVFAPQFVFDPTVQTQALMPIAPNNAKHADGAMDFAHANGTATGSRNERSNSSKSDVDVGSHMPQYAHVHGAMQCTAIHDDTVEPTSQSDVLQSSLGTSTSLQVADSQCHSDSIGIQTGMKEKCNVSDRAVRESLPSFRNPNSGSDDYRRPSRIHNDDHRHRDMTVRSEKRGWRQSLPNHPTHSSSSSPPSTDLDSANNEHMVDTDRLNEVYGSPDSADDDEDEDDGGSAPQSASSGDEPRARTAHDYRQSATNHSIGNGGRFQRTQHRGRSISNRPAQMNGRMPLFSESTVAPRHRYMLRNAHSYNVQHFSASIDSMGQKAFPHSRNGDEVSVSTRKIHRSMTIESRHNVDGTNTQHNASMQNIRGAHVPLNVNGTAHSYKRKRSGEQLSAHGVS